MNDNQEQHKKEDVCLLPLLRNDSPSQQHVHTQDQGDRVEAGEAIAIIGNSGKWSSGPHLHFELWYNNNPVDPEQYILF